MRPGRCVGAGAEDLAFVQPSDVMALGLETFTSSQRKSTPSPSLSSSLSHSAHHSTQLPLLDPLSPEPGSSVVHLCFSLLPLGFTFSVSFAHCSSNCSSNPDIFQGSDLGCLSLTLHTPPSVFCLPLNLCLSPQSVAQHPGTSSPLSAGHLHVHSLQSP